MSAMQRWILLFSVTFNFFVGFLLFSSWLDSYLYSDFASNHEQKYKMEFVFDDHLAIKKNPLFLSFATYISEIPHQQQQVTVSAISANGGSDGTSEKDSDEINIKSLWDFMMKLFESDFWGKRLTSESSHKSWRPLSSATFALQIWLDLYFKAPSGSIHSFFGKHGMNLDAYPFRLVNALLHGICSSLVTLVCFIILKTFIGECKDGSLNHGNIFLLISLLTGLLFAIHPVHCEAVTGIVGRTEILSCIFSLFSFIGYHYSIYSQKLYSKIICLTISMLALAAGLMSKENAIMTGPFLLLYELVAYVYHLSDSKHNGIGESFVRLAIVCQVIGLYLGIRMWLIQSIDLKESELLRKVENPLFFVGKEKGLFSFDFLASLLIVHGHYCRLLLFPMNLCAEYSYNCIPMVNNSILTFGQQFYFLFSLFSYISTLYYAVIFLLELRKKMLVNAGDDHVVVTGLFIAFGWMYFFPASHIGVTIGTLVAERLIYTSSISICFLLSRFMICFIFSQSLSWKSLLSKILVIAFLILIITSWIGKVVDRNKDWNNDESLFLSAVEVCPGSAKLHRQMGDIYVMKSSALTDKAAIKNMLDKSMKEFNKALEIYPGWCDVDISIGKYHVTRFNKITTDLKDVNDASSYFIKALDCKYTANDAVQYLQDIWKSRLAIDTIEHRNNAGLHQEMGSVYRKVGALEMAFSSFVEAAWLLSVANKPENEDRANKLVHEALDILAILERNPNDFLLCKLYLSKGLLDKRSKLEGLVKVLPIGKESIHNCPKEIQVIATNMIVDYIMSEKLLERNKTSTIRETLGDILSLHAESNKDYFSNAITQYMLCLRIALAEERNLSKGHQCYIKLTRLLTISTDIIKSNFEICQYLHWASAIFNKLSISVDETLLSRYCKQSVN